MRPAYAPFPTPSNLWFHVPGSGNHTSNPIFEAANGWRTPVTRQKAGTLAGTGFLVDVPASTFGVKMPASTGDAVVTINSGVLSCFRSAQDTACDCDQQAGASTAMTASK